MLRKWWRLNGEGRELVWRMYGRFCGLMLCGSVFGAVAWGSSMQSNVNLETGNSLISTPFENQRFAMFALWHQFEAVFSVTYAVDFLCLSVAKLMVLDRLTEFFMAHGDGIKRRWVWCKRIVIAVVVLISVAGLCGNVTAAVYQMETSSSWSRAYAALASNDTIAFEDSRNMAREGYQRASSVASVQMFCELVVLHLILFAFAVVGVACVRLIRTALLNVCITDASAASARKIRLQILGPVAVVFVSFLLRSVHATMHALANQLQDRANLIACTARLSPSIWCEDSCFNVFTHMSEWMDRTPEFELMVVLVSSPLALLVALWGMTSERALQLMRKSSLESGSASSLRVFSRQLLQGQ
jgi:hypothetical protein